jgi:hypothetical protein
MSETVRRNRTVSPAEYEELQELVFDLVRERVLAAIGAGGMWSVNFRSAADTDAFFGETVAERIAKDVAARIAPQPAVVAEHAPSASTELELHTAEVEIAQTVAAATEVATERVVWVAEPSQAAWVAEFAEAARPGDRDDFESDKAADENEHHRLVA